MTLIRFIYATIYVGATMGMYQIFSMLDMKLSKIGAYPSRMVLGNGSFLVSWGGHMFGFPSLIKLISWTVLMEKWENEKNSKSHIDHGSSVDNNDVRNIPTKIVRNAPLLHTLDRAILSRRSGKRRHGRG